VCDPTKTVSSHDSSSETKFYALCGKSLVVHEEEINLAGVFNEESFVAGRHQVSGLLVGAVTDLGHCCLALEPPSHSVVNAFWLPPV